MQWLDLTRMLCAVMILGIHWLRATYKVGLFGAGDPVNLVMNYQQQSGGFRLFHYVLLAGPGASFAGWLTNAIGLLGGFGWEAVSALVLVSGFSLALSQRGKTLDTAGWFAWYGKRARRILVPFYLVAIPFLAFCAVAVAILPHLHEPLAAVLDAKLLSQFHTPPLGVLLSHVVLLDPYAFQWGADFVAPAWWFVPAILLAYAAYPALRYASRFAHGMPLLAGSALVTIGAYAASNAGIITNETWYYIVLQELFNFSLGIVLAHAWLAGGRPLIERLVGDPRVFCAAFALFVIGNVANWSPQFRPVASMLYGPSLVVMLVFIAKLLERRPFARHLTGIDAYDLYLVHQPFAYPIAFGAELLFHQYAVFIGWFVFLAVATIATKLLSAVQRPIFAAAAPRPAIAVES